MKVPPGGDSPSILKPNTSAQAETCVGFKLTTGESITSIFTLLLLVQPSASVNVYVTACTPTPALLASKLVPLTPGPE